MRRLANHDRRLAVLREQRVERVQQGKMLRLHRQRLFRNRHCLRRHREGEMTDNRADSVLVPVINGEIRAATGFEPGEICKVNPRIEIVFAGRGLRRRRRFGTVAERRQAETRRDHP